MPAFNPPTLCRPVVCAIQDTVDVDKVCAAIGQKRQPAILGGNPSVRGVSVFAAEPLEVFEFFLHQDQPFERLNAVLSKYQIVPETGDCAPAFCGGWIGYFGYELGRFIEQLPCRAVDDVGLPVIRLAFYDKAIVYDHASNQWHLTALEFEEGASSADKINILRQWLDQARECSASHLPACKPVEPNALKWNMSYRQYRQALARIHQHILDGDVYQINYSARFEMPFGGAAIDLFRWQNRHNPSPYAAFLAWDDAAVVSASPELFLEVSGQAIRTCPIKGTRKRIAAQPPDSPANRAQRLDLQNSAKDQAELAMIVDLERNDLARICVPGTRQVVCPRRIETFPTVFHAVGEISGRLAEPPSPRRLETILRATFPGGSITGAPKIRAMEIIDALEPTARGVYTGAIGWLSPRWDMCFNIAIRTIVVRGEVGYAQSGGGIVADSQPDAEWQEVLTKAAALAQGIAAFGGANG